MLRIKRENIIQNVHSAHLAAYSSEQTEHLTSQKLDYFLISIIIKLKNMDIKTHHIKATDYNGTGNDSTYLEEQHDDGKDNFCNLCQEVHTDWAKFEFPIHFTHVYQYRLQKRR